MSLFELCVTPGRSLARRPQPPAQRSSPTPPIGIARQRQLPDRCTNAPSASPVPLPAAQPHFYLAETTPHAGSKLAALAPAELTWTTLEPPRLRTPRRISYGSHVAVLSGPAAPVPNSRLPQYAGLLSDPGNAAGWGQLARYGIRYRTAGAGRYRQRRILEEPAGNSD